MLHTRRDDDREHGQILILFALSLVVILAFAAIVVDLGMLRNNRQILVNTLDAAALAGGTKLPVDGSAAATPSGQFAAANALIASTISANYPGLPTSAYKISYRCQIGSSSGAPDMTQITAGACNPTHALLHTPGPADFVGVGSNFVSACDPSAGDKCNVVVVTASATTPYGLGGVVGITSGSTGTIQAAACNGPCGARLTVPVDLVIILDRTWSMSDTDITNVQAGANAVLSVYDPAFQRVALGTVGPSQVGAVASCPNASSPAHGTNVYGVAPADQYDINHFGPAPTDLGMWIPVKFTGTDIGSPAVTFNQSYSTAGTPRPLNTNSYLVKAISCVVRWSFGTNLDTPVRMAGYLLQTYGRPGVKKGIILETDGTPQAGDGTNNYTCDQANQAATDVKALLPAPNSIVIYTIGYGMNSTKNCPTTSENSHETSFWATGGSGGGPGGGPKSGATLLASMASDPGKFFNAPASSAVADAFKSAAQDLTGAGLKLVQATLPPIVTSVSPSHGPLVGGNSVAITGQFFTAATAVTFGGTGAAFTVNSDTSITATAPGGTNGTVDVMVTTPGGPSTLTSADRYAYP